MDHYQKKLLKKGFIAPLVIALIITAGFFAAIFPFASYMPFTERSISLAEYEKSDIIQMEKVTTDAKGNVKKSDILPIEDNTALGTVEAGQAKMPLIYNANEVNASGSFSLSKDSVLIGETGCAVISCCKSDSSDIKSLKAGDKINIETVYGNYVYEVRETAAVNQENNIKKAAGETGKSLIIYTDNSNSIGISGEYFTVICKFISGNHIAQ